ncbi:uncharacterized protein METZ01_LOCUS126094, partial [marine metagenome]
SPSHPALEPYSICGFISGVVHPIKHNDSNIILTISFSNKLKT